MKKRDCCCAQGYGIGGIDELQKMAGLLKHELRLMQRLAHATHAGGDARMMRHALGELSDRLAGIVCDAACPRYGSSDVR